MESQRLNQALIRTVGVGWVAFAVTVMVMRTVLAVSEVTLLVDRSYCEPAQWSAVADQYADLYQQDQQGRIDLQRVILYNDLGQETLVSPPTPEGFRDLKTYGQASRDRQMELQATYPNARLLQCP